MRSLKPNRRLARCAPSRTSHASQRGFTITELIVVAAIIAILASLLLPALNRAKGRTQTIACLNNLKQLQFGWHMYVDDNDGQLPPNNSDPSASWCPGDTRFDTTPANIKRGLMFSYVQMVDVFHCPSDRSRVEADDGHLLDMQRTRSYSMSASMNYDSPGGTIPTFKKFGDIINPPPHMAMVFVDENERSIADARFELYPESPKFEQTWINMPSDRHGQGANMSFADAHVEHWTWQERKVFSVANMKPSSMADVADLHRIQSRLAQDPGY